ncbi:MAG: fatty acid metabolism transcriptional regulator FadR [Chloroflexota bacterium]
MDWQRPPRPTELAETRLIEAVLSGHFPIGASLPPERDLALQLGVTRPTLREALQRMARDGWVEIRHGRPTRVRDYWHEGSLGVLAGIARHRDHLPPHFVPDLLHVRLALAPAYTRLAVARTAAQVVEVLEPYASLPDSPDALAQADWDLHRFLAIASGNPVFTLILNGFGDLYLTLARRYFATPKARRHSAAFYRDLLRAARAGNADEAEAIARRVMSESLELWQRLEARAQDR